MEVETFFGNRNKFGIRFIPNHNQSEKGGDFALLHLILEGQVIGDPTEESMVGTWLGGLKKLFEVIDSKFDILSQTEFINKSDHEIFELIYKSNQLEEEYDEKYKYLKILDNEVWQNCNVTLDETADAYLITVSGYKDYVKFIWKGLREPCPADEIGKLRTTLVERNYLKKILADCINEVQKYSRF